MLRRKRGKNWGERKVSHFPQLLVWVLTQVTYKIRHSGVSTVTVHEKYDYLLKKRNRKTLQLNSIQVTSPSSRRTAFGPHRRHKEAGSYASLDQPPQMLNQSSQAAMTIVYHKAGRWHKQTSTSFYKPVDGPGDAPITDCWFFLDSLWWRKDSHLPLTICRREATSIIVMNAVQQIMNDLIFSENVPEMSRLPNMSWPLLKWITTGKTHHYHLQTVYFTPTLQHSPKNCSFKCRYGDLVWRSSCKTYNLDSQKDKLN